MPARLDPLTARASSPAMRIGDCVVLGDLDRHAIGPAAVGAWVRGGGASPVVVHRARALGREIAAAEEASFAATSAAGTRGASSYDAGTVHLEGDASFVWFEELVEGLDLFELLVALGVPRPGYEVGVRLALMRRVLAAVPAGYAYDELRLTPTTMVLTWSGHVRILPRMDIPPSRRLTTATRDDHDPRRWMSVTPETARALDAADPPRVARQRVFQVGAVLAWIATGTDPFASSGELERLARIARGDARVEGGEILARYPRIGELLRACLVADARDRPESVGVIARDLAMAVGTWSRWDLRREIREDEEDPIVISSRMRDTFLARVKADERTHRRVWPDERARASLLTAPAVPFERVDLSAVARRTR